MDNNYNQIQKLVTAVTHMRRLQSEYFRTRDRNILVRAKNAEKCVDDMCSTIQRLPNPQESLFKN